MIQTEDNQPIWGGGLRSPRAALLLATAFAALIVSISSIPAHSMPAAGGIWRWDKAIHACEYGIAAMLVFRAVVTRQSQLTMSRLLWVGIFTTILCSLFGCLDELYQGTVPGRDSSGFDVLADIVGASFASIMSVMLYSKKIVKE